MSNNLSSLLEEFNRNFIKKNLIRVIQITWVSSLIFTTQVTLLYLFYPVFDNVVIIFWIFSLLLTLSFYISKKDFKYSYEVSATILFVSDFLFINSLILFSDTGIMSIYNPGVSYVFMMFIAFTIFAPNTFSAILHSFSYASCATFYFLYSFKDAQLILNDSWYELLDASKFTYLLAHYLTASIVSYYVWYRSNKYSKIKTYVYRNILTSAHSKLISPETVEFKGWYLLTCLIDTENEFYGGDFIAFKDKKDSIEIMIGDVVDHGIDTSQISFGLLSIFHSQKKSAPEEILLQCHDFLLKLGYDLGGESYICIAQFFENGEVNLFGSTGINPFIVKKDGKSKEIKTHNFVFGSNREIQKITPINIKLKFKETLIIRTDGWNQINDEKASVIASFNNYARISQRID